MAEERAMQVMRIKEMKVIVVVVFFSDEDE